MTNIIVLDVVIGLVFIYLLYSLLATIIQELLSTLFSFRSKLLERAICRMLEDEKEFYKRFSSLKALFKKPVRGVKAKSMAGLFYSHPLIKYLGEDKHNSKPSYISRETFSKVIIDLLRGEAFNPGDDLKPLIQKSLETGKIVFNELSDGLQSSDHESSDKDKRVLKEIAIEEDTLKYLRSIWVDAQGEVDAFRKSLEQWFDDTMDRCSGWYKKHTQFILFVIGLAIAVVFNVDTISIAGKLQKDPALRAAIVQQADEFTKAHPNLYEERINDLKETDSVFANTSDKAAKTKADAVARAKNDSLINRGILLTHKADSLINGDIAKTNGLLGLGWSEVRLADSKWCKACKNEQASFFWSGFKCCLNVAAKCLLLFLGWLITALAMSLGAPFWFDLLNKLMKLRSSVSTPSNAQNKGKDEEKQQR